VDVLLGPEMRSTGEVMGIDSDFGRAYAKSQIEAGNSLPERGCILVSLRQEDQVEVARELAELAREGFRFLATAGTARALAALGIPVEEVAKVGEGSPDTVERIRSGQVDMVINTVGSDRRSVRDSASLRRAALNEGLPYFTTAAAARAAVGAILALRKESIGVRALQRIHASGVDAG
jgi:carbamoyl-phosphate synthase large subunit